MPRRPEFKIQQYQDYTFLINDEPHRRLTDAQLLDDWAQQFPGRKAEVFSGPIEVRLKHVRSIRRDYNKPDSPNDRREHGRRDDAGNVIGPPEAISLPYDELGGRYIYDARWLGSVLGGRRRESLGIEAVPVRGTGGPGDRTGSAPPVPPFGAVPGVSVGQIFENREALYRAGVHRKLQGGIVGTERAGAESVVLNQGYEDDIDDGDEIIYTGEGGRDPNSGLQIADQQLTRGNRALAVSSIEGRPVRVIRGPMLESQFRPERGFRYDGLYFVSRHWHDVGKSGFSICRFLLIRESNQPPFGAPSVLPISLPQGSQKPGRRVDQVQRVVRSTAVCSYVKQVHQYRCQVCGTRLETAAGPYAEAAHIRPLGKPHDGPDVAANVLCLCPNHHVLFDYGMISVADDGTLIGDVGKLRLAQGHSVDASCASYHRNHIAAHSPSDETGE